MPIFNKNSIFRKFLLRKGRDYNSNHSFQLNMCLAWLWEDMTNVSCDKKDTDDKNHTEGESTIVLNDSGSQTLKSPQVINILLKERTRSLHDMWTVRCMSFVCPSLKIAYSECVPHLPFNSPTKERQQHLGHQFLLRWLVLLVDKKRCQRAALKNPFFSYNWFSLCSVTYMRYRFLLIHVTKI